MAKAPTGDDAFFDYRNDILKNVLGYTDQAKLDKFERLRRRRGRIRAESVQAHSCAPIFSKSKRFFDEVYPWAGELRPTDLQRPGYPIRAEFDGHARLHPRRLAAEKHLRA
jgi:fido (protein-threonine AMPylation protein)